MGWSCGAGQIGEAVGSEPLRPVGDFAGLIEHQDGRNRNHMKRLVDAVGEDQRAPGFLILKKWRDHGFVFIGIDRQEDNILAARKFRPHVGQHRFHLIAVGAPGGPEIQDHDFSVRFGQLHGAASIHVPQTELQRIGHIFVVNRRVGLVRPGHFAAAIIGR